MDNNIIMDEVLNPGSMERKNRFIFSDDYYDQIPLENNDSDINKKVVFEPKVNQNNNMNISVNNEVHQTNDFDKLVKNDYEDENVNMFDFFGHNANTTDVIDSSDSMDYQLPQLDESQILDNNQVIQNDSIFSSIQNPFMKKNEIVEEKVEIEKPIVEDNYAEFNQNIPYIDNSVVENEIPVVEEPQPFVAPVDTSGIGDGLIDNIVDYKAPIIQDNNIESSENVFSIGENKKVENALPTFMTENTKVNAFDVETGINQELEKELMEQKRLEEEQRLRELNQIPANYLPEEDNTEILYRAGGKSIVREKQDKVISNVVNKPEPIVEEIQEEVPSIINIDQELEKEPKTIQDMIENILDIPNLDEMVVPIDPVKNPGFQPLDKEEEKEIPEDGITTIYDEEKENFDYDQNFENVEVIKSDLLDELKEKATQEGKISILARYGEDFCSKDYVTNPAIGRADEIKQLILILLTPEKSGILIGKPGIGKTSIVEGLAYQLQRNNVPDVLKGYRIVSVKTASLLGSLPNGETRLQTLVDELKELDKIILFVDEIHMLIGATNDSALDFANMFKESLGRGSIKVIGATTTEEYERYILRDKAFVRRFQKVEVEEPDRTHTIKILMGTLPKIEKSTGAKLKYTEYIQSEIMAFIVDITTEYKRIYGIGSRYPDICLTLLAQAFSQAVFANRKEVTIIDIRRAIENSKNIYPDVIRKELVNFDKKFKDIIKEEELNG